MRFGQALRVFRTAADVGLRELARKVGVSPGYLSQIETGKLGPPSGSRLSQIARALSIPPAALLHITGRTDPAVLDFLQRVPETSDLVRAVMEAGLGSAEIVTLSQAVGGGGREALGRFLAASPGPNGGAAGARLLDHLEERKIFPRVSCRTREELFDFLAGEEVLAGTGLEAGRLGELLRRRESESSTSLGEGVAIPHARVPGLARPMVALVRRGSGIEYEGSEEKPVRLVFLLLSTVGGSEHLELLAQIAEVCNRSPVVGGLLAARGRREMLSVLRCACDPDWRRPAAGERGNGGEPRMGNGSANSTPPGGEPWSPNK